MEIKKEKIEQFIPALFNMMEVMKKLSEICCNLCGGITEKELFTINLVGQKGHIKMTEIAEGLHAPVSTTTGIVDKMVEKKYLVRTHSEEDRRVIHIALTEEGEKCYGIFLDQKMELESKVLQGFSEKQQEDMLLFLLKFQEVLPNES